MLSTPSYVKLLIRTRLIRFNDRNQQGILKSNFGFGDTFTVDAEFSKMIDFKK